VLTLVLLLNLELASLDFSETTLLALAFALVVTFEEDVPFVFWATNSLLAVVLDDSSETTSTLVLIST
jgi:hypothetical protein